jgi:hypothetical protein
MQVNPESNMPRTVGNMESGEQTRRVAMALMGRRLMRVDWMRRRSR